jgi:hypothetical protein
LKLVVHGLRAVFDRRTKEINEISQTDETDEIKVIYR